MTVLGIVAEMERRFILDRQRAGIEAAKKKGIYKATAVRKETDVTRKPQQPPQLAKWTIYKMAAEQAWLGEIESADQRKPIE